MILLLSPSKCPECGALYWGIPECQECGWIDSEWKEWEGEQQRFWEKNKDKILKEAKEWVILR